MKTKAPHPIDNLQNITNPFIKFFFEFVHLKQLYRQGWLAHGIPAERCESVAEHTLGVAVIAMLLATSNFPELDSLKVLRMAIIHDFGEIYAGDIIPGGKITPVKKYQLEREAVTQIFEGLPSGGEYLNLWEEFESGASPEARFVRQIDKLEMALQASIYEHQNLGELLEFYTSASKEISSPALTKIIADLKQAR